MTVSMRKEILALGALLVLFFWPAPAWANFGLIWIDPLGGLIHILPLVILLEAALIRLFFSVDWFRALWVSGAANGISTLAGVITLGTVDLFFIRPVYSLPASLVISCLLEYPFLRSWLKEPPRLKTGVILTNLASYTGLFVWWMFLPRTPHARFYWRSPFVSFSHSDGPLTFVKELIGWHQGNPLADFIANHSGDLAIFSAVLMSLGLGLAYYRKENIRKAKEAKEAKEAEDRSGEEV